MVEHVLAVRCKLGEGPLWDWRTATLHWVDIDLHRIHCIDPASGAHDQAELPFAVGAIGLRAGGGLIAATRHGFAGWDLDEPHPHTDRRSGGRPSDALQRWRRRQPRAFLGWHDRAGP